MLDIDPKKMQELTSYGTILAYIAVVGYGFWKVFAPVFKTIKEMFGKKPPKEDTSSITVNVNSPLSDLAGKEDFRYFLYLFLEQGKILRAMYDMRTEILRDQMDYYNKHMGNLKIAITNVMLDLLKDSELQDGNYNIYFANFENFIEVCENKVQILYRNMCKENHFSEYSAIEFEELIKKNTVIIVGTIADLIRKRYPQKNHIKNFDKVYSLQKTLKTSLSDCFEYAREAAMDKEQKVKCAKEEFEKQVSEIIGIKYSLEL